MTLDCRASPNSGRGAGLRHQRFSVRIRGAAPIPPTWPNWQRQQVESLASGGSNPPVGTTLRASEGRFLIASLSIMEEDLLDDLVTPLKEAVDRWNGLGWEHPAVAVVSGSGLGVDLGERIHGP